jgi:hypothetical protein
MSKMVVVETWKQLAKVGVIQSFDVGITTIRVEKVVTNNMDVAPNMDVVRRGVLIRFVAKLGCGLDGVSIGKNLS